MNIFLNNIINSELSKKFDNLLEFLTPNTILSKDTIYSYNKLEKMKKINLQRITNNITDNTELDNLFIELLNFFNPRILSITIFFSFLMGQIFIIIGFLIYLLYHYNIKIKLLYILNPPKMRDKYGNPLPDYMNSFNYRLMDALIPHYENENGPDRIYHDPIHIDIYDKYETYFNFGIINWIAIISI